MGDLLWNNPNELADQITLNSFGVTPNLGALIPVPEPVPPALLAIGGLALMRRRQVAPYQPAGSPNHASSDPARPQDPTADQSSGFLPLIFLRHCLAYL
jgi:hypothetical protein